MSSHACGRPEPSRPDRAAVADSLCRAIPVAPTVTTVALATGAAVAIFPDSVTVEVTTIIMASIAVGFCALTRTRPADRPPSAPARPQATPTTGTTVPPGSKTALALVAVAIAVACVGSDQGRSPTGAASLATLAMLAVAAGVAATAALELIDDGSGGALVRRHHHPASPPTPTDPPAPTVSPGPNLASPPTSDRAPRTSSACEHAAWPGVSLTAWSTPALCRGWKLSFLALRAATDAPARARVAEVRRRYLDELARRDPAGFHQWVEHDPYPVAGHPEQFIRSSPAPPVSEV